METRSEKENLVIFGIGKQASEVVDFVQRYGLYNIIGFIVDKEYMKLPQYMGKPVYPLEDVESYLDVRTVKAFVAISWYNYLNKYKRLKYELLKKKGFHFVNLISPLASVNCHSIGEGNLIMDYAYLGYNSEIGDNNTFCALSLLGHNSRMESHNVLAGRASIAGKTEIGNQNYFGLCSIVFNKLKIGNKCLIGGGSIVKRDIPDFTVTTAPESHYKQAKEKYIESYLSPKSIEILK